MGMKRAYPLDFADQLKVYGDRVVRRTTLGASARKPGPGDEFDSILAGHAERAVREAKTGGRDVTLDNVGRVFHFKLVGDHVELVGESH
jgi:hypothetical protein